MGGVVWVIGFLTKRLDTLEISLRSRRIPMMAAGLLVDQILIIVTCLSLMSYLLSFDLPPEKLKIKRVFLIVHRSLSFPFTK